MAEFNEKRADLYKQALEEFPTARREDLAAMHHLLNPRKRESILAVGEGNGHFIPEILKAIGSEGNLVVADPSAYQLANLKSKYPETKTHCRGAEEMNFTSQFEKVWTFGAFHHCTNQERAMQKMHNALRRQGRLTLCDVWRGSPLAEHFDGQVARYCVTGHDVKFLGDTYARTIAEKAGFTPAQTRIKDLNLQWRFKSEQDIGKFIYNLHAMTLLKGTQEEKYAAITDECKKILGIERKKNEYALNWPMKVLTATKN